MQLCAGWRKVVSCILAKVCLDFNGCVFLTQPVFNRPWPPSVKVQWAKSVRRLAGHDLFLAGHVVGGMTSWKPPWSPWPGRSNSITAAWPSRPVQCTPSNGAISTKIKSNHVYEQIIMTLCSSSSNEPHSASRGLLLYILQLKPFLWLDDIFRFGCNFLISMCISLRIQVLCP